MPEEFVGGAIRFGHLSIYRAMEHDPQRALWARSGAQEGAARIADEMPEIAGAGPVPKRRPPDFE